MQPRPSRNNREQRITAAWAVAGDQWTPASSRRSPHYATMRLALYE